MRKLLLSLGIFALAAGPASAIESLTGTWAGKLKCVGTLNGTPVKTNAPVTVTVSDGGPEGIAINVPGGGGILFGFTVADTAKPLNGHATAVSCGEIDGEAPLFGAVAHLDVATKAAPSTKASMKGDIIKLDDEANEAVICTLTAKRTDTTAPPPLLCVEL
jgi:hypothetical protein